VLLLDEPTAALGVRQSAAVLDTVRRLSAHGIGVVLISHNIEQVMSVCDRLVCLFQGRLMLDAPMDSLSRDRIVAAMMGSQT
jgi:ABC-type sugar transport system ATPase subunit